MKQLTQLECDTQNRVVQLFQNTLGYKYLGNWEDRQHNSNLEEGLLRKFLQNQGYTEAFITKALQEVRKLSGDQARSLYEVNKEFYGLLRYGVKVKAEVGGLYETVWLIDWNDLGNNDFYIAEEVSIKGENKKRPDIVIYVNGIALGVIELKRGTVSVNEGIRQNLDNQKANFIKNFFNTIQLVLAGNDTQGLRYGVIKTSEKYYQRWKEEQNPEYQFLRAKHIDQIVDEHTILLDQHIMQFCHKERFLELIQDFIIFDGGVKKICRPQQYFGIKAAQLKVKKREGGIIWHTQGSGKSLTMVWLAQWVRDNMQDARVLLITDRTELDEQIERVFKDAGEKGIVRAKSGADLIKKLNKNEDALICSLVHKFGGKEDAEGDYDSYIEDLRNSLPKDFKAKGNIYVFVDECHRTQSGKLNEAMREILPDAMFVGFTGTPLLKKDKKKSVEIFGPYIHTYKFNEAVEDGVVLDLRYEARDVDQELRQSDKVDQWFEKKTKGLTDVAKAELKKKWGTMQKVLSARSRIEKIVDDIIFDFGMRPRLEDGRGNAMLVAGSVYEACKYYEIFIARGFDKCAIVTSYTPVAQKIKGESTGTGNTDEIFKYDIYKKMLGDKPTEDFEKEVKRKFIEEPGQMQLLIVVDKLLTGFDAPSATYLYIDKSMRDHGLFQAICRVNRLDTEDKEYGYVIDYKDLFDSLKGAIEDYTGESFSAYDKDDVAGLLKNRLEMAQERLDESLEAVRALCEVVAPPRETRQYVNYFCGNTENPQDIKDREHLRVQLYKSTAALVRAYAAIANEMIQAGYTQEQATKIKEEVQHYSKIRDAIKRASGDYVDLKAYEPDMRRLIDMYIYAQPSQNISEMDDLTLIELIVDQGEGALDKLPQSIKKDQTAMAETIENNLRKVIIEERPTNPKYYDKMSELLTELIQDRKQKALEYEAYLQKIIAYTRELKGNEGSYPTSIQNNAQKALYDWLGEETEIALALDKQIRYNRRDGWIGHPLKEKALKNIMKKALSSFGYDLGKDDIGDLLELVKQQHEYK